MKRAHECVVAESSRAERAMRQTVGMLLGEGMTQAEVCAAFKNIIARVKPSTNGSISPSAQRGLIVCLLVTTRWAAQFKSAVADELRNR